jgi:5-(carboxyamino)imidazole ribonucleotide synthase
MRIGIVGKGQLGQMLALAGLPLGHEICFYDLAQHCIDHSLNISSQGLPCEIRDFFEQCDVVTYETENTPIEIFETATLPIFPPVLALKIAQDRLQEKTFFQQCHIPTVNFCAVDYRQVVGLEPFQFPGFLKTRRMGYDGKGQAFVQSWDEVKQAWEKLDSQDCLLEEKINFKRELSIIGARDQRGKIVFYPLTENTHHNGILRYSIAPAQNVERLQPMAEHYLKSIFLKTQYCGVLALELFEPWDPSQPLIANEMAPRVHNSGHWSIEGTDCSQFENHIRAITGLPVKSPKMTAPCVGMVNLIGTLPSAAVLYDSADADRYRIHLYGKTPRANRKLGHITFLDQTVHEIASEISHWESGDRL